MRPRIHLAVASTSLALALCGRAAASEDEGGHWGADYFPNVLLTTHEGKEVRFFDDLIRDKVVVINFIYTSCPDVCPLETAKLAELQAILGERVGDDVFMYSISIDPETDTPEVLQEYAASYGAGPGWTFLTGREQDITLLRKKLGLYIPEVNDEDPKDHNLSLIIGNQATGRWMKRSPFENPYYLASQVGSWLHNWKLPAPNQESYANAPELRDMSRGERLFRTRCAACHVIGTVDEVPPHQSGRLLGPDLLNVTERRDPEWLARWLREPDRMLAEGDPLATELYAKHGRVSMPNMGLEEGDVRALLEFLEAESRRVAAYARAAAPTTSETTAATTASCCQKDEKLVLSGGDDLGPPAASAGSEVARPRVSASVTWWSVGLGSLFFSLAALTRRRPAASAPRASEPDPVPAPRREAPLSCRVEVNP